MSSSPLFFFNLGCRPSSHFLKWMLTWVSNLEPLVLSATLFVSVVMCYGDVPFRLTLCSFTIGS
jgi:hypothetical protein